MKTWPYNIWRIEPVLLRELPLVKGYMRNPGKQEARESGSSVLSVRFQCSPSGSRRAGHTRRHSDFACLVSMLHQAAISLFVTFVTFCSRRIGIGANSGRMAQV